MNVGPGTRRVYCYCTISMTVVSFGCLHHTFQRKKKFVLKICARLIEFQRISKYLHAIIYISFLSSRFKGVWVLSGITCEVSVSDKEYILFGFSDLINKNDQSQTGTTQDHGDFTEFYLPRRRPH